jgi:hypothetical protein
VVGAVADGGGVHAGGDGHDAERAALLDEGGVGGAVAAWGCQGGEKCRSSA